MSFLRKVFSPRIPILFLNGAVDNINSQFLLQQLESLGKSWGKQSALALVINSSGGSAVHADTIAKEIREYCENKQIPLYTFTETGAFSAAAMPLLAGSKVYAQSEALVGRFVAQASCLGVKNSWGITRWTSPTDAKLLKKDYRLIGVEEDNESQARFAATMSDLLAKDTENLVTSLKEYRTSTLASKSIEQGGQGVVFTAKEALANGLVDELGSYHKILRRDFPNSRLDPFRLPTTSMAIHRAIKLSNYFGVRLVIYIILVYKVLSYVLKFLVLKAMVPKDKSKGKAAK